MLTYFFVALSSRIMENPSPENLVSLEVPEDIQFRGFYSIMIQLQTSQMSSYNEIQVYIMGRTGHNHLFCGSLSTSEDTFPLFLADSEVSYCRLSTLY